MERDDDHGWTPLHIAAASRQHSRHIISGIIVVPAQKLVEANPAAACVLDKEGRLPLHIASAHEQAWMPVVQALLQAFPAGAQVAENMGMFPYQLVAQTRSCHLDCLYELIRSDPTVLFL